MSLSLNENIKKLLVTLDLTLIVKLGIIIQNYI